MNSLMRYELIKLNKLLKRTVFGDRSANNASQTFEGYKGSIYIGEMQNVYSKSEIQSPSLQPTHKFLPGANLFFSASPNLHTTP